jgi:hypothetical protein
VGRLPVILMLVAVFAAPTAAEALDPPSAAKGPRAGAAPIPGRALRQIAAKHGQLAYVPTFIASGFTLRLVAKREAVSP